MLFRVWFATAVSMPFVNEQGSAWVHDAVADPDGETYVIELAPRHVPLSIWQTAELQSESVTQAPHVCVLVLHTGVGFAQSLDDTQPTHVLVAVSQVGVVPLHSMLSTQPT